MRSTFPRAAGRASSAGPAAPQRGPPESREPRALALRPFQPSPGKGARVAPFPAARFELDEIRDPGLGLFGPLQLSVFKLARFGEPPLEAPQFLRALAPIG